MADEIIAKYKADLKDYNSEIKKGTNQAEKDFDKVDESASTLNKTVGKLGAALAAAFAVDRIVSFTAEASKLAAAGEGVRKAFERIGDPQLLQGLRDATRGTVSDLELMKNAVKASNFKIPLQELAKLFEFARRRAKETGESVQFLVESITTGIGRKSPLILDNLGISAVELKKRLNGVSLEASSIGDIAQVVGAIATDELRKMGEEAESTKDKMDKLTASTDNLKEALGTIANETLGPLAAGMANLAQAVSDELTEMDRLRSELVDMGAPELQRRLEDEKAILDRLEEDLVKRIGTISEAQAATAQAEIDDYRERVAIVEEYIDARNEDLDIENFTIDQIGKKVAALKALSEDEKEQVKNVAFWRAEIKRLQAELGEENRTIEQNIETVNNLTKATEELNKILKPTVDEFERLRALQGDLEPIDIIGVDGFGDTLKGLKEQLSAQRAIMEESPEFSQQYTDAAEQVDYLTERIENFGERTVKTLDEVVLANQDAAMESEKSWEDYYFRAEADVMQFYGAISRIQSIQLDQERQELEDQLDRGLITRDQYERQVAQLAKKRLENEKAAGITTATINTALGVTQALANSAPPLSYVLAAAVAAAGAAEIAAIASQDIPQFAKGTKNAPAGFKWVGEEGPELIYDQGGYPIITHIESMKILEKYNIPTVNYESIQKGGFEGTAESAKLNGFNDSNMLFATDRLRNSNKQGFAMLADAILKAGRPKRGGYA